MHHMPFAEARDRLAVLGVPADKAEAFWLAVRGNLDTLATLHAGGGSFPPGRRARRNFPARTATSCATPIDFLPTRTVGSRHVEGLDRPGQGSDRPQGQGAVSCRSGWRLLDCLLGRIFQIYCRCWVGKEHWPDDPDLALSGRRHRRDGRLRLQDALDGVDVEPAFEVGQRLRIGAPDRACRPAPGIAGSAGDWSAAAASPAMIEKFSPSRPCSRSLRPRHRASLVEIGGRQRRIGLAGHRRYHRRPIRRRPPADSKAASRCRGRRDSQFFWSRSKSTDDEFGDIGKK